ncbi:MAG: hypothetical protein BGO54_13870 [Sphingobacteriales bacterium 46-32]|nr:MAG: hypothetical protein BGO54_13870 [Sphingobacteriales bacterium 46-32]
MIQFSIEDLDVIIESLKYSILKIENYPIYLLLQSTTSYANCNNLCERALKINQLDRVQAGKYSNTFNNANIFSIRRRFMPTSGLQTVKIPFFIWK